MYGRRVGSVGVEAEVAAEEQRGAADGELDFIVVVVVDAIEIDRGVLDPAGIVGARGIDAEPAAVLTRRWTSWTTRSS